MTTPLSKIVAEALRRAEEWVNVPMQASDAAGLREELREAADRLQSLALSGAGEVAYSARFSARRGWEAYPMGTRAYALEGGYWERVPNGWKWCSGSTFPTPGADAFEVAVPATHPVAPGAGEVSPCREPRCTVFTDDPSGYCGDHAASWQRGKYPKDQPAAPAGESKFTAEYTAKMRKCAVFLSDNGGDQIVRECADEIDRLRAALAAARLPGGGEADALRHFGHPLEAARVAEPIGDHRSYVVYKLHRMVESGALCFDRVAISEAIALLEAPTPPVLSERLTGDEQELLERLINYTEARAKTPDDYKTDFDVTVRKLLPFLRRLGGVR